MKKNEPIQPPPGDEILTPDFLRKFGAVEGMKVALGASPVTWVASKYTPGQKLTDHDLKTNDYIAPTGTTALLSTPLPEGHECRAICANCKNEQHDQLDRICDVCGIAALVNNRLVKVLPGWLEKCPTTPKGLLIGRTDKQVRWQPYTSEWPAPCSWSGNFAYSLPFHVWAKIESERKGHSVLDIPTVNLGGEVSSPTDGEILQKAAELLKEAAELLEWNHIERLPRKIRTFLNCPTLRAAIKSAMEDEK